MSFQDDDSLLQLNLNKDPFANRRNTNVAFAGRMRNTRSLFGQEISNLYLPNKCVIEMQIFQDFNSTIFCTFSVSVVEKSEAKNENNINSPNKAQEESDAEKTKNKKASEENKDDKKTQDNQSPKEQVCLNQNIQKSLDVVACVFRDVVTGFLCTKVFRYKFLVRMGTYIEGDLFAG